MLSRQSTTRCLLATATAVALIGAVGCGEEPEPVAQNTAPVKREEPPPPPPQPKVESVASLMQRLGIDERVVLPEEHAPRTTEGRIAVLKFFHGFATGDHEAVGEMLSPDDAEQLQALLDSGQWDEATSDVLAISLRADRTRTGEEAALAVIETFDSYQPQMWSFRVTGTNAEFTSRYTPHDILDKISDPRMIKMWFDAVDEELALANKPDEEFVIPQQDYDDSDPASPSAPSTSPGPTQPTGPTGPAIPRHKPSRKRNPKRPGTSPGGS